MHKKNNSLIICTHECHTGNGSCLHSNSTSVLSHWIRNLYGPFSGNFCFLPMITWEGTADEPVYREWISLLTLGSSLTTTGTWLTAEVCIYPQRLQCCPAYSPRRLSDWSGCWELWDSVHLPQPDSAWRMTKMEVCWLKCVVFGKIRVVWEHQTILYTTWHFQNSTTLIFFVYVDGLTAVSLSTTTSTLLTHIKESQNILRYTQKLKPFPPWVENDCWW